MKRNALAGGGWKSVRGASKWEKKYEDGCTHLKVRSSSFHHGVNECVESVVDVRTVGHQQQKITQPPSFTLAHLALAYYTSSLSLDIFSHIGTASRTNTAASIFAIIINMLPS